MPLITIQEVKDYLIGIGEAIPATHDALLTRMVGGISGDAEDFCRRKFDAATYTSELHTGKRGQQHLYPHQWPINSVTSVKIDGTAITEDTDFTDIDPAKWVKYKTSDGVWVALFLGDTWESDPMGIEITYNGGYTTIPDNLKRAVTQLCVEAYLHRGKQGLEAESFAGMSLNFDSTRWPTDALKTLGRYKRPQI